MTTKILHQNVSDPVAPTTDISALASPSEDWMSLQIYRDLMADGHAVPVEVKLKDPKVILDLGANYGYSTWELATAYPSARVYAVELDESNCEVVRRNTHMFGDRVAVVNGAIAAKSGPLVYGGLARTTYTTLYPNATQHVAGISMDDLFKLFQIEECDYIKMDIEGSELDVLTTGGDWLKRTAVIKVEVHEWPCDLGLVPSPEDNVQRVLTLEQITEIMEGHGFTLATRHYIHLTFLRDAPAKVPAKKPKPPAKLPAEQNADVT